MIVVPGTSTLPLGSFPPRRIECDIADPSYPDTSQLWHRPHPLGSIESISLVVELGIGEGAADV